MNFKFLFLILILFSTSQSFTKSHNLSIAQKDKSIDERIENLIKQMTLEEKVAQMRMFHANIGVNMDQSGHLRMSEKVIEKLKLGIGGIKNAGAEYSPEKSAQLNNELQKYIISHNRLGIPAFFVTESYNGVDARGCTRFARPINMAATWNTALVKSVYDAIGREARLRGLHLTHSPEADIVRDPRFGRMSEAFSEDTYLTTEMIVSAVTGLQGDYVGLKSTHIGAVTKHFAAYAQVSGGKNFASIEISPRTLIDEILPPFKAAVQRAKTLGIMVSHGDINGVASHANPELLTNILRNQWGFNGYVVSDANDIGRLFYFMKVAETPEDAAILALKAGVDVDLYAEDAYALLPKIIQEKPELLPFIDNAVRRVLRTKFILGLFDNPYNNEADAKNKTKSEQTINLAKEADNESVILLKNSGVLPLSDQKKMTVALVGPLLSKNSKSQFELIANKNIQFITEKGFKLTNEVSTTPSLTPKEVCLAGIQNILDTAKKADVVVLYVGGDEYTSKEAYFVEGYGDRDNIDPVGQQDELLLELKKLGKPIVVVLKHRRTLSINTIAEYADAILDTWDLSAYGEEAIAKALFGKINPSGKLPVTVPHSIGQLPFHYSQKEINRKKGYLFTENKPLFPFGFGLSYTNFEYSNLQISDSIITSNSTLKLTIDVKNTGKLIGKEVVQMYLKDIAGSVTRPDMELKGFEKIELQAGENKTITFSITPEMLKFTKLDMKTGLENGNYELMVGGASDKTLMIKFKLINVEN